MPPSDVLAAGSLCSCHTTTLPSPGGDIAVVRVYGDVDSTTVHVLAAALADARARRAGHLVVDLAGLGFCSVRGLGELVDGADTDPVLPLARYALSGARPRIWRYLDMLWAPEDLPARYAAAGPAVLAALTDQRDRLTATGPPGPPFLRAAPDPPEADPPEADPTEADDATDAELATRARTGDRAAYRTLVRRHRTRMYRSALQMLGAAEDPADVAADLADDLAARLRAALGAFGAADPP